MRHDVGRSGRIPLAMVAEREVAERKVAERMVAEREVAERLSAERMVAERKERIMAATEAQKRAVKKYKAANRERIHRVTVEIYDSKDPELWKWLTSRDEGKGEVIRRLMREEIERTGWTGE